MPGAISLLLFLLTLSSDIATLIQADPNDWVNVGYVLKEATAGSTSTADARNGIIVGAGATAKKGPWSVTNSRGITAPSGDSHDYLSWAPYHWPDCNWCRGGKVHLSHNSTDDTGEESDSPKDSNTRFTADDSHYSNTTPCSFGYVVQSTSNMLPKRNFWRPRHRTKRSPFDHSSNVSTRAWSGGDRIIRIFVGDSEPAQQVPVGGLTSRLLTGTASQTDTPAPETVAYGAPTAPAQAHAHTTQSTSRSSCTPSPTTSMAPSATWTTCPYITRDGQVNPDVRALNGPESINSVSQSILYNALAYSFKKSSIYSNNVASFVDTYYLNDATKMNPNMNFGQVIRGPGESGQSGTFAGILDLRGIVKIVNGILVLKGSGSPEWTTTRDQGMIQWMTQYSSWLEESGLGKKAASRPNNHNTFYISQLAAVKILVGDNAGAASALRRFFSQQFLDQIAASGEQPFEAVRTRPFHYRCFNLEAMIVNAKLGDQLGLNLWSAKSKYGATIQTALDFVMSLDPGGEDVEEVIPHVASIAAAYGDPNGKYKTFMANVMSDYQDKPFWFYDQTAALSNSPAAKRTRRSISWRREDSVGDTTAGELSNMADLPFECPAVFDTAVQVEVDDGVFVTCDELKPYYEAHFTV